jgi:hypothetical protein
MKTKKQRVMAAGASVIFINAVSLLIAQFVPFSYIKAHPAVGITLNLVLLALSAVPMFYLTGTLMHFITGKIVSYAEQQKARQLPIKQRVKRNIMVWLVLACVFGIGLGSFNLSTFWALSKRGVSTQGYVLKTEKEVLIQYRFRVGQKVYIHSDLSPVTQKLKPGARVPVLYDPQNPQVSILGPVKPRLDNELMTIGLVILCFPALLMYWFKKAIPIWKRNLTKQ